MAYPGQKSPEQQNDPPIGSYPINYSGGDQDINFPARGIYISTAGTLKMDFADGSTDTWANLVAGTMYPCAITKIYQTGSSNAAGNILR